jgi:hypothetical protein
LKKRKRRWCVRKERGLDERESHQTADFQALP